MLRKERGSVHPFHYRDGVPSLPYRFSNSLSFQLSMFGRLGLTVVCMVASSPDTAEAHMAGWFFLTDQRCDRAMV
jgi:hypothetical protein